MIRACSDGINLIASSNTTVVTKNYVSMSSLVGARDPGVCGCLTTIRHDTLAFARLNYNCSTLTTVVLMFQSLTES